MHPHKCVFHTHIFTFPLKSYIVYIAWQIWGQPSATTKCAQSISACKHPSMHTQSQRHTNAYRSVAQTHRWYKSVSSLPSLTPVQVGHKVWTDTYAAPHVYTAIWASYPCGCALHTFLAWWMLQYSCQPGHPKAQASIPSSSHQQKTLAQAREERLSSTV